MVTSVIIESTVGKLAKSLEVPDKALLAVAIEEAIRIGKAQYFLEKYAGNSLRP